MKKAHIALWLANILVFLFSIILLLFVDMKGGLFGFSIIVSYLVFGATIFMGVLINIFLLLNKARCKWICYALIVFFVVGLFPLFTHHHPSKDHILMLMVKKSIWPEGYSDSPNIPMTLTDITSLEKLKEIEKTELDAYKKCRIIIFNQSGFQEETWIAYCKSDDLKSSLSGLYVLLSNGHIDRVKESDLKMPSDAKLKYYILE